MAGLAAIEGYAGVCAGLDDLGTGQDVAVSQLGSQDVTDGRDHRVGDTDLVTAFDRGGVRPRRQQLRQPVHVLRGGHLERAARRPVAHDRPAGQFVSHLLFGRSILCAQRQREQYCVAVLCLRGDHSARHVGRSRPRRRRRGQTLVAQTQRPDQARSVARSGHRPEPIRPPSCSGPLPDARRWDAPESVRIPADVDVLYRAIDAGAPVRSCCEHRRTRLPPGAVGRESGGGVARRCWVPVLRVSDPGCWWGCRIVTVRRGPVFVCRGGSGGRRVRVRRRRCCERCRRVRS